MKFKGSAPNPERVIESVWDESKERTIATFRYGEPFETDDPEIIEALKKRGYKEFTEEKKPTQEGFDSLDKTEKKEGRKK